MARTFVCVIERTFPADLQRFRGALLPISRMRVPYCNFALKFTQYLTSVLVDEEVTFYSKKQTRISCAVVATLGTMLQMHVTFCFTGRKEVVTSNGNRML